MTYVIGRRFLPSPTFLVLNNQNKTALNDDAEQVHLKLMRPILVLHHLPQSLSYNTMRFFANQTHSTFNPLSPYPLADPFSISPNVHMRSHMRLRCNFRLICVCWFLLQLDCNCILHQSCSAQCTIAYTWCPQPPPPPPPPNDPLF